ncbi:tetraspanin 2A isoform X1 [Bombus vancouverensis nearcticus]|uniref:Tetraspanin n=2 Tax=Pyrobombus TaxID=144703 RepID=A0A6P8LPM6_9HYME|nr:tetraspanin-2A [Bombus vancouverensis nearcticus]XP_033184600.1 tetraspanin-2A [Bombus vancouverensis nearcticus]XP_033302620.1 tetraspanin-2A [Bombus bifarius]XP_033302621.1 tetraspanin-2A [Bombus bifarius]
MVGKTSGPQLEQRIQCIKFTIFCLNAIIWLLGSSMFGLCMWLRMDPDFQEWVAFLEIYEFYIGIYILLTASIFIVIITFIGCGVALMEHILGLYVYVGLQLLSYVLGLAGTAVLLDYSTYDSNIQPLIRRSMTSLINNYHDQRSTYILQLIQESIGCCGADGPMDYITLRKPLPTECRNTVTGNAFFYGCVEEISWFLEGRSGWLAGLSLGLCMLHIIIAALSLALIRAIKKEEQSVTFKH